MYVRGSRAVVFFLMLRRQNSNEVVKNAPTRMNENDSGPASLAGGFKTIISMSLVAVVDGALCFVNQSQFVRLSVVEGSRRFESRRDVGSRRRVSAGAMRENTQRKRRETQMEYKARNSEVVTREEERQRNVGRVCEREADGQSQRRPGKTRGLGAGRREEGERV